jgi:hypothetical protein
MMCFTEMIIVKEKTCILIGNDYVSFRPLSYFERYNVIAAYYFISYQFRCILCFVYIIYLLLKRAEKEMQEAAGLC